jgi:hypothetical protein
MHVYCLRTVAGTAVVSSVNTRIGIREGWPYFCGPEVSLQALVSSFSIAYGCSCRVPSNVWDSSLRLDMLVVSFDVVYVVGGKLVSRWGAA